MEASGWQQVGQYDGPDGRIRFEWARPDDDAADIVEHACPYGWVALNLALTGELGGNPALDGELGPTLFWSAAAGAASAGWLSASRARRSLNERI